MEQKNDDDYFLFYTSTDCVILFSVNNYYK